MKNISHLKINLLLTFLLSFFTFSFSAKNKYLHHLRVEYNFTLFENETLRELIEPTLNRYKKIMSDLFLLEKPEASQENEDINKLIEEIIGKGTTKKEFKKKYEDIDIVIFFKLKKSYKVIEPKVCSLPDFDSTIFGLFYISRVKYEKSTKEQFEENIIKSFLYLLGFNHDTLKSHYMPIYFDQIHGEFTKFRRDKFSLWKYNMINKGRLAKQKYLYNNSIIFMYPYGNKWHEDVPDIMSSTSNFTFPVLTELTMGLIDYFPYMKRNKCDFEFINPPWNRNEHHCLRPDQNCFNDFYNGFINYAVNNDEIVCYLDKKNNIKKQQCGNIYGKLTFDQIDFCYNKLNKTVYKFQNFPVNKQKYKYGIPELDVIKEQKIFLLKGKQYRNYFYPRTVYFVSNYSNNIKVNKNDLLKVKNLISKEIKDFDVNIEKIKNKKFFVSYRNEGTFNGWDCVIKIIHENNIIRTITNALTNLILTSNKILDYSKDIVPFKSVPRYVKIGHIPLSENICHKMSLHRHFNNYQKNFAQDYNFMTDSFLWPEEKQLIMSTFKDYEKRPFNISDLWLVKPDDSFQGLGISFFSTVYNVTHSKYLITKYIINPHLINGYKYDLRVYVLITGISPLKIYVYREGLLRRATNKYLLNEESINDYYQHLTNVALNKKNKGKYKFSKDYLGNSASKWSFKAYEKYLDENYKNIPKLYNKIRKSYIDIIIKACIMISKESSDSIEKSKYHFSNYFQLFGFDILIDSNFKTYLLEINADPDFNLYDEVDSHIKPGMMIDLLNIVGIVPFSYEKEHKSYDINNKEEFDEITKDVYESVLEFKRPYGRYERVFPLKNNIEKYKKFFEGNEGERNAKLWNILKNSKNGFLHKVYK